MTIVSPHLSKITLTVIGLKSPIKRYRVGEFIKNKTEFIKKICSYKRLTLTLRAHK